MNRGLRLALLLPAAALIGCTLPSATSTIPGRQLGKTGRSRPEPLSPRRPHELYFTGAVQTSGYPIHRSLYHWPAPPVPVRLPFLVFLGTYNSSTGAVALQPATTTSAAYAISYTAPSTNTVIPVNVTGGCVAPFGGALMPRHLLRSFSRRRDRPAQRHLHRYAHGQFPPALSGTATLVLTQTATPNSSGQFPLSGTITFPSGSGFGTAPARRHGRWRRHHTQRLLRRAQQSHRQRHRLPPAPTARRSPSPTSSTATSAPEPYSSTPALSPANSLGFL